MFGMFIRNSRMENLMMEILPAESFSVENSNV